MLTTTTHFIEMLIGVLVAVSFYTLYERKTLRVTHTRKGPEVVGAWGLLQPFADAIKLLTKEWNPPAKRNYLVYMWCPTLMLLISLSVWRVIPYPALIFSFKYMFVVFFIITSLRVYAHLGRGWRRNSNYAIIGRLRCITQTLSYEVTIGFTIMTIIILLSRLDLKIFTSIIRSCSISLIILPIVVGWGVCSLAETNRRPFDFGEGERELVSGFNVEYGSGWFTFMFLAEYANMIFISGLLVVGFITGSVTRYLGVVAFAICLYMFVWIRTAFPRTRYDKLIYFCWFSILPGCLFYIIWCVRVAW